MLKKDKLKGILLVILGISGIIFLSNFDIPMRKRNNFRPKVALGFIIGVISVVNGIRIYRRK